MKIRTAEERDLSRLLQLYDEPNALYSDVGSFGEGGARRRFEAVLADPRQETIVADDDGEVVGTLVVAVLPNLAHGGAPYAVVENVVVDEGRRGEGLGRMLMQEALERVRAAGAYKLALSANVEREGAHRFYEALGMRRTHLGFEAKS